MTLCRHPELTRFTATSYNQAMIPLIGAKIRFRFFLFMTAALVLGGCKTPLTGEGASEPAVPEYQDNASADADDDGVISPLEAHLMARKLVNPAGDASRYTYQADKPHEDFNSRLQALSGGGVPGAENEHALHDASHEGSRPPVPGVKPQFGVQRQALHIDGKPYTPADVPVPPRKPQEFAAVTTMPEDEVPGMPVQAGGETATISAPPPVPARSPAMPPERVATRADGDAAVTGLRLGEHPGRTRLVLDLSGASGYSVHIDNRTHVLRIELPAAGWNADTQKTFSNHPLFKSYRVGALGGGGSVLSIDLKQSSKVITSVALPPNDVAGHRIYFDIGPG